MAEIVVTVVGDAASGNVSLPDDVPVGDLVGGLSRHYAPGARADPVLDASGTPLDLDAPLCAQAIADGTTLRISRRSAALEPRVDDPGTEELAQELGVIVVGSNGVREALRVPATAPMRVIAARLGDAIGVAQVADVRLGDGTLVPPTSSLADLGVRTGASLLVRCLGDPTPTALPPTGKRSARNRRRRVLAAGLAVVVVVGVGVVVGRASAPGSVNGYSPAFRAVAVAWRSATVYRQPVWPGVGHRLGREGKLAVSLEPAGSWSVGEVTGQAWIASAPGSPSWGLEAVAFGGRLGYDPTPTGLPFVTGEAPPIAGRVLSHPGKPPAAVGGWVDGTWGKTGTLTQVVGMGAIAASRVLITYRPPAGGLVWRVQVDLSAAAPGAPLGVARAAVSTEQATVLADTSAVASAQQAAAAAQAALTTTQSANPVDPAALSAAQAALAGAQGQAQAAQAALATDASTLHSLGAREAQFSPLSAVGTYDLWVRGGRVVGWAPAGYGGGDH